MRSFTSSPLPRSPSSAEFLIVNGTLPGSIVRWNFTRKFPPSSFSATVHDCAFKISKRSLKPIPGCAFAHPISRLDKLNKVTINCRGLFDTTNMVGRRIFRWMPETCCAYTWWTQRKTELSYNECMYVHEVQKCTPAKNIVLPTKSVWHISQHTQRTLMDRNDK